MRKDRGWNELRPISIEPDYLKAPEGSCLVRYGQTWVLCAATVSEGVPSWLSGGGQGWVTAEYALLPRAVPERKERRQGGREKEIARMIGRSLRAGVDLRALDGFTITIDCDVIQADGGTRAASVTGGFVALVRALEHMKKVGILDRIPTREFLAGISVALVGKQLFLDPDYNEDLNASVDANFVISEKGNLAEVQISSEEGLMEPGVLAKMLEAATPAARDITEKQREALKHGRNKP
ncbi:MAG: ribonuclease PH [Candidatus Hydrothermia bacterium]